MARNPEFKKPEGVTVKQPEPLGSLFGDEHTAAEVPNVVYKTPELEWETMPVFARVDNPGAYPFSGEPVWLTPDGDTEYLGVWRVTREFKDGRFQPVGFWAQHNGGGLRLNIEPIGYRRYEPPVYKPAKRA